MKMRPRRSAFEMRFSMTVGQRLAAEGEGWLVGYDYGAGEARPLPDALRDTLAAAAA